MTKYKEEKKYMEQLSENEFKKYLKCLDRAKESIEENNVEKTGYWLRVAGYALSQSASYKSRAIRYHR